MISLLQTDPPHRVKSASGSQHIERVICLYLLLSLSDTVCLLLPLSMPLLPPLALLLVPRPPLLLWLLRWLPLPGQLPLLQSPLPPLTLLFTAAMLLAEAPWLLASDFCGWLVMPDLLPVPLPSLEGSYTKHAFEQRASARHVMRRSPQKMGHTFFCMKEKAEASLMQCLCS